MQAVESNVSRRRLLGSVLTLGAGAAIGSTVSFPSPGVVLTAAARENLVHEELIRQLKESVRALRGARPGEAARGVAATLRLLAAHYQTSGLDTTFRTRLRRAIAQDGRDAVLRWEADPAMRASAARDYGVADLALAQEPFNLTARERALDAMLARGATPALLAAAAELTRVAPDLDRVSLTPVARRQCSGAQGMASSLEFVSVTSCLLHPAVCSGFSGAYLGLELGLSLSGC